MECKNSSCCLNGFYDCPWNESLPYPKELAYTCSDCHTLFQKLTNAIAIRSARRRDLCHCFPRIPCGTATILREPGCHSVICQVNRPAGTQIDSKGRRTRYGKKSRYESIQVAVMFFAGSLEWNRAEHSCTKRSHTCVYQRGSSCKDSCGDEK
jgi:hypothetical protein